MPANQHISDELPLLLTGDATRDVVMAAAHHLRECVDCQQELVSAVIAHASLTSAHRFAPDIVNADTSDTTFAPRSAPGEVGMPDADETPAGPLPDLSSLFAEVRADTPTAPTSAPGTAKPGAARRRLLAVAAAAVVAGGGITTYALVNGDDTGPASRTVALEGISDASDGSVKLVGDDRMVVDATALPRLGSGHQYEVWLTDENNRQAVGYLRNGSAEISVPSTVMDKYKGIAVSVQRNGQTEFSGKVVLNGTYG